VNLYSALFVVAGYLTLKALRHGSHGYLVSVHRLRLDTSWSLEDRRTRADVIEVNKMHGLSTVGFNTFFEFSHNKRTREHFLKLYKTSIDRSKRHFFSKMVINKWNTLSEDSFSFSTIDE